MNDKYNMYREKYKKIIYKNYNYEIVDDKYIINYEFDIPGLTIFKPSITFDNNIITNKKIDDKLLNKIIFDIGLVELINYYKLVCPKTIELEVGYLNKYEQDWFKKLYIKGLGEFFYRNAIDISNEELFEFVNKNETGFDITDIEYEGYGNLVPLGGGKDSYVTLELLKGFKNTCIIFDPKLGHYGATTEPIIKLKRNMDKNLDILANEGYFVGHAPFNAMIAFITYLIAYLTNKKYIVLSNEGSANEPTVIGTDINHQYSKSYEFECDFYNYTKNIYGVDIKYFSMLRPIKEIQIAYLFSKYTKYHKLFRSCNIRMNEIPWDWCCNCAKCLFVYIILSVFIEGEKLIDIFGEDLLEKKELEPILLELIGKAVTKPFECVGTIEEVKYALNNSLDINSYLVKIYKEKYYDDIDIDLTKIYYQNNVPKDYLEMVIESLKN